MLQANSNLAEFLAKFYQITSCLPDAGELDTWRKVWDADNYISFKIQLA